MRSVCKDNRVRGMMRFAALQEQEDGPDKFCKCKSASEPYSGFDACKGYCKKTGILNFLI